MIILQFKAGLNYGMHHVTSILRNDTEPCGQLTFSLILQNSDDQ